MKKQKQNGESKQSRVTLCRTEGDKNVTVRCKRTQTASVTKTYAHGVNVRQRRSTGTHFDRRNTETPQVRFRVVVCLLQHLRCHPIRSTDDRSSFWNGVHQLYWDTEIGYQQNPAQVGRLKTNDHNKGCDVVCLRASKARLRRRPEWGKPGGIDVRWIPKTSPRAYSSSRTRTNDTIYYTTCPTLILKGPKRQQKELVEIILLVAYGI